MQRRIRTLEIDAQNLVELFKGMTLGMSIVCTGIPQDARVIDVKVDPSARPHTMLVFLESETFEFVPEGAIPSVIVLSFIGPVVEVR